MQQGGDVIGRNDIYVKTVLLILFEGFTSILVCWIPWYFPSRSYSVALI